MASPSPLPQLPSRLHHFAFTVRDQEANRRFFEDLLGLPLVATWCEKVYNAEAGRELEYCHTFYGLGELLRESAKIDIVHVPYKGAGPAITDLLGGQIPLAFVSLASVMSHVKSGKLRAMAVVESQRYKGMPEIPTIKETVPSYDMFTSWLGFFAPAGTPREIVARLNGEINRALADPELAAKLESSALVRLNTTPEQFTEMVKKELALGARFAKMFGVKP